jgi:hypothetical protein
VIAESNSVPTTDGTQNVLLVFDVHNIVHAVVPILLQTPAYVSASCPGPTKMAPQNPVGFKTKKNMKIDTEHRNRYLFPDIKKKTWFFPIFLVETRQEISPHPTCNRQDIVQRCGSYHHSWDSSFHTKALVLGKSGNPWKSTAF